MKKLVLLLGLFVAICCNEDVSAQKDRQLYGSMSEPVEYKLYDSDAKTESDVMAETTSVSLGGGVVLLGVLALSYGALRLKNKVVTM